MSKAFFDTFIRSVRADQHYLLLKQGLVPVLLLIIFALSLEYFGIDQWLAGVMYQWEGGVWALKDSFLFEQILHRGLKKLLVVFDLTVLGFAIASIWVDKLKPLKKPLWFLFLALATSPLIVSIGKSITHVDCPWDIVGFGGQHPYLSLFESHPGTWKYGRCFPAGHSSGGYSLVALYFFFLQTRPEWRRKGLLIGVLAGTIFGVTQQFRGAHFVSHDIWSLIVCLSVSIMYYTLMFKQSVQYRLGYNPGS